MLKPAVPVNEDERLKDLYRFNILDTAPEEDFNDLVELIAEICSCPIVSITFIDKDRQWFKAKKNIADSQGTRTDAFCAHTILEEKILVVEDTRKDERFADNPFVTSGLRISFYAGVPITSSNGYALGSVCAMDRVPRSLTAQQVSALQKIARQVSRLLDLRLRNKEIITTTEKLVQAEQTIAQFNMKNHEEDKLQAAFILHEEIAQSAAAIRLYINHVQALSETANPYLDYSVSELEKLRAAVTKLSRELSPTTMMNDNYSAYIHNAVDEWVRETGSTVRFKKEFIDELKGGIGLNVFRIVQDLLRLAGHVRSEKLQLSLRVNGAVSINASYNISGTGTTESAWLHEGNIRTRVLMLNGKLETKTGTVKHADNTIKIQIPLAG